MFVTNSHIFHKFPLLFFTLPDPISLNFRLLTYPESFSNLRIIDTLLLGRSSNVWSDMFLSPSCYLVNYVPLLFNILNGHRNFPETMFLVFQMLILSFECSLFRAPCWIVKTRQVSISRFFQIITENSQLCVTRCSRSPLRTLNFPWDLEIHLLQFPFAILFSGLFPWRRNRRRIYHQCLKCLVA